ncbi:Metallo-dependent phosphatase [Xylaria acuta]|nr:Metallo-dependent phosphatase [Xylaria acuta]
MAGDGHHRPRNRVLILAVIAFILSTVLLACMRLNPISLAMASHSTRHEPEGLKMGDDAMAPEKSKHDKGGKERTYPQVSMLPASLLPTNTSTPRRLMIIGDVHGHLKSLEALLREAEFSTSRGDTVVFAGDMVNKGPDSAGVVALAMQIGAFGVRGNHEHRVLRAWEYLEAKKRARGKGVDSNSNSDHDDDDDDDDDDEEESVQDENENGITTNAGDTGVGGESEGIQNSDLEEGSESDEDFQSTSHEKKHKKTKGKKKKGKKEKNKKKKLKGHKRKPHHIDLVTAKSLKPEHRAWLSRLPLILRIGDLGPRYGEVLVVHAGLVPGIPLESQDPEAVMTMRTILLPPSSSSYDGSDQLLPPNPNPDSGFDPSYAENNHQTPLTTTTTTADHTQDDGREEEEKHEEEEAEAEAARSKGRKHHHRPTIMIPSASRKGVPWAEIWTSYQRASASLPFPHPSFSSSSPPRIPIPPATVVYGHDAKAGLQMRKYAFGVDSGCGNGDTLTGVLFEFGGERGNHGHGETTTTTTTTTTGGEEGEREAEENETDGEEGNRESQGHRRTKIRHRLVSMSCADE